MQDLCTPVAGSNKIAAYTLPLVNPVLQTDETLNDSNKIITVSAGELWEILSIYIKLETTSTSGNRQIGLYFFDDSSLDIAVIVTGATQAASLTKHYTFFPGAPNLTAFVSNNKLYNPIPRLILPPGYQIKVFEFEEIDPSADDMYIRILTNVIEI